MIYILIFYSIYHQTYTYGGEFNNLYACKDAGVIIESKMNKNYVCLAKGNK